MDGSSGGLADAVREAALLETDSKWRDMLEVAVRGVAAIRCATPRAFDTYSSGFGVATGFVVDSKRGILLTNQHVVKHSPTRAEAVFFDHEEVPLRALYRDPVHDFGFFRFNPKAVKYMDLAEIPLNPEGAAVGVEIRVVGNDAGEKLSILSGTIARLDRPAPFYGEHNASDFNTFYIQAASSTSGGSSGSPVIDINGAAIALNAGGRRGAATSYYLPLFRVLRALQKLQSEMPESYMDELPLFRAPSEYPDSRSERITSAVVPRGTLQTVFRYVPFDELRRLGLRDESETRVRRDLPHETGMLVVDQVIAEGPGFKCGIEEGDILVEIDGTLLTTFVAMESALDNAIGEKIVSQDESVSCDDAGVVELTVERGGKRHVLKAHVDDLHEITPSEFLEVGQGSINMLSYQEAKNNRLQCGSAPYLASSGFIFGDLSSHTLIRAINGKPTESLQDVMTVLANLRNRQRVSVKYVRPSDRFRERTGLIEYSTEWQRMRWWRRNDCSGLWSVENVPVQHDSSTEAETSAPSPNELSSPRKLLPWEAADHPIEKMRASPLPLSGRAPVKGVEKSLVMVSFSIPYVIDGCYSNSFQGVGLVVDWEKGLVVVDRNTVPICLGNVLVSLGGSTLVPGRVVFLHPVHNFAVVQFDSTVIDNAGFESATLFEGDQMDVPQGDSQSDEILQNDELFLFGMSSQQTLFVQRTVVAKIESISAREARPPRYRAMNSEGIWLEKHTASVGGVLADAQGRVRALWASFASASSSDATQPSQFFRGMPVELLLDVVGKLRRGEQPVVYSLEVELKVVKLSAARVMGLSDAWVQKLEATSKRNAVGIARIQARSHAFEVLRGSDLLLAVDSVPVTDPRAVEVAIAGKEEVELTLLRDTKELTQSVKVAQLDGQELTRVVIWAGCMIQETHRAVFQLGYAQAGVYCSRWYHGSPAHQYGLRASMWITHVNDVAVANLDEFLDTVRTLEAAALSAKTPEEVRSACSVRLKVMAFQERSKVVTLKPDLHYWPTVVIGRCDDENHWQVRMLSEL